jgi:hypothetical protein
MWDTEQDDDIKNVFAVILYESIVPYAPHLFANNFFSDFLQLTERSEFRLECCTVDTLIDLYFSLDRGVSL